MRLLPKIELHCHLDGSLRPETIYDLATQYNTWIPTNDKKELRDYLVAPLDCDSLETYLKRFDLPISVMQSKEALIRCAFELVEDYALENVKYLEIRFNPYAHTQKGLLLYEVIESVLEGIGKGEDDFDIKVNLIMAFNRTEHIDTLYKLIDIGKNYIEHGLVAVDLCAAESESFVRKFVKPIIVARKAGFKVTIHAGETGYPKNVIEAVEYLDTQRIGHGVAIIHDESSLEYIANSDVLLEVCPTSNIQTKAFASYKEHPVNVFLNKGIKFSIGTDNRTVSNISLSDEFNTLASTFGWNQDVFKKIYNMSIEGSFASRDTKDWLKKIGDDFYGCI